VSQEGYSGGLNRVFFDRIFLPFPANYKLGISPIVWLASDKEVPAWPKSRAPLN
jgi:hypothetical protein